MLYEVITDNYTLVVLAQKETPIANGSVDNIENYVRNGGNAVFIASEALEPNKTEVDLVKILPVKPRITSYNVCYTKLLRNLNCSN